MTFTLWFCFLLISSFFDTLCCKICILKKFCDRLWLCKMFLKKAQFSSKVTCIFIKIEQISMHLRQRNVQLLECF